MQTDMNSVIKALRSSSPAAITAGNATLTGQTINRAGYNSHEWLVIAGALTDSLFTCTLYESDDSGMSGETAVADKDLIGQTNAFVITGTAGADSNTVTKVGYKGTKQYCRLKIVQSGATTGGFICSVAIQGEPLFAPVS